MIICMQGETSWSAPNRSGFRLLRQNWRLFHPFSFRGILFHIPIFFYSICNASHTKFCAISFWFMPWRALGNLDNSSCGTATLVSLRCCFSAGEDSFFLFVLFVVLDTTDRPFPVGLKLGCPSNTGIWFWKSKKKTLTMLVKWKPHGTKFSTTGNGRTQNSFCLISGMTLLKICRVEILKAEGSCRIK